MITSNFPTIGIHQPEFLPWLGFFNKISMSDKFVLLDNVPFRKNYFQNRNKIKGPNGAFWLTIPLIKHPSDQLIKDIKIDNSQSWQKNHIKSIEIAYKKAPYFERYFNQLCEIINKKQEYLIDLNGEIIRYFMAELGISTKLTRASTLDVSGHKSELLLNICKKMKADTYLSGVSGKDYLNQEIFRYDKIEIAFQDFKHPTYNQLWGEFIPKLSALDLLFNEGEWK